MSALATAVVALSLALAAPTEDLGELWRSAQTKLGTSDYAGAIELLTRMYEQVALDPEAKAQRLRVQWALHEAHLGAYSVDADPEHLHVARDLVRKYREELAEEQTQKREEADASLAKIDAEIAALEEPEEVVPPPEEVEEPPPEPEPAPPPEPPQPADPPPEKPSKGFIIGGSVLLGVGAAGAGMLIGGLVSAGRGVDTFETDPAGRDNARDQIRRGNAVGIAGGVLSAVFVVSGSVLLAVGLRRRGGTRYSFRTAIGPKSAAVALTRRF